VAERHRFGGPGVGSGSAPAGTVGQNAGVGFNPYAKHRRRPSDYLMVVAAFVVVAVLLVWAVVGS
jgi:hypothetical protein